MESPTKAKSISKMLGSNYKVMASVGHIRDLPKSKLGIDVENNFEPNYINIRGKGPLIKELKTEAKKANKVLLATDPDREGEAIAWHLAHILELNPEDSIRVTFNEITKNTVKEEIKNPRAIDMGLVDAQQARRVLDRLVGYKISPLLWKKIKNGLSAGRVQSVALKIICDREREIQDFVPEEYWSIEATLKKGRKSFVAEYIGSVKNGKLEKNKGRITDRQVIENALSNINRSSFVVNELNSSKAVRSPYQPFTTSTMQQEASKRINFSTKKTMMVAQKLYEGINIPGVGTTGLITYMRTDSVRISDEAKNLALKYIEDEFGKEYVKGSRAAKAGKSVQDAHECIRPTDITKSPISIKEHLTNDEFKLYNLIWNRFLASLMSDARYDKLSVNILSNTEMFNAKGRVLTFDGFLRVYGAGNEKDEILPEMEVGDLLKLVDLVDSQHFTQPPARYNEAGLIKYLEENGIGRPSTYSPIISTIQSRYYVVMEEKRFVPTELGETVNELLLKYFKDIDNEKFTADLETELDKISEGDYEWKNLIARVYNGLMKDLEVAERDAEKFEVRDEETDVICEKCGRNMVIKIGRFGKFLACPGFPDCRNAKPLVEEIGIDCPKCSDGKIVVKRSKKGRKFYGCSNYPECDFVTWNEPIDRICPTCGEILTKVVNRRGELIKCSNSKCDYSERK